jgi:hypothetical protein
MADLPSLAGSALSRRWTACTKFSQRRTGSDGFALDLRVRQLRSPAPSKLSTGGIRMNALRDPSQLAHTPVSHRESCFGRRIGWPGIGGVDGVLRHSQD